jgi:hypothetical protein
MLKCRLQTASKTNGKHKIIHRTATQLPRKWHNDIVTTMGKCVMSTAQLGYVFHTET